jgi:hypothetical protein
MERVASNCFSNRTVNKSVRAMHLKQFDFILIFYFYWHPQFYHLVFLRARDLKRTKKLDRTPSHAFLSEPTFSVSILSFIHGSRDELVLTFNQRVLILD